MFSLALIGALLVAGSESAAGTGGDLQPAPGARVWVEEDLDMFYPGDPVNLRFRTTEDAYVAILHVDTEGMVDLVYPSSRADDDFVYGMRTYSLPLGGRGAPFRVSRTAGIGYFYIIASRHPLDLGYFFNPRAAYPGYFGHGRQIRGDPFWALEQLALLLVGDRFYGRFASDIYSYHIGGLHRYPSFACYDRFAHHDFHGYPYYTSCFELQRLLTRHPHYYDTRRYRGDRRVFVRELDRRAPVHGFKERPDVPSRSRLFTDPSASDVRGRGVVPTTPVRPDRDATTPTAPRGEAPAVPSRQRPTLERRAEPRSEETRTPEPQRREPVRATPQRESSPPPSREAAPQPARGTTGGTRRAEPARESTRPQSRDAGSSSTRAAPQRQQPAATSRGSGSTPARAAPASAPSRGRSN